MASHLYRSFRKMHSLWMCLGCTSSSVNLVFRWWRRDEQEFNLKFSFKNSDLKTVQREHHFVGGAHRIGYFTLDVDPLAPGRIATATSVSSWRCYMYLCIHISRECDFIAFGRVYLRVNIWCKVFMTWKGTLLLYLNLLANDWELYSVIWWVK